MAKPKTEIFEIQPRIKFEVRVTPKKICIDLVNSKGLRQNFSYIEYVPASPHIYGQKAHYIATRPNSSWMRKSETIEGIIKEVEIDLDLDMPQVVIDVFTARQMDRVLLNGK